MERKCCTFFGHRTCPSNIKPKLRETIAELIEKQGVIMFYVGNQGQYDSMVRAVLRELQAVYPNVRYAVVLAYMPADKAEDSSDTMLPEGIESVPKRFAISWRNKWMLDQCDYVVTYITRSWGGAAQYAQKAERQKKTVIHIDNSDH